MQDAAASMVYLPKHIETVYAIVPKQDSFKQIPLLTSLSSISRIAGLYSKHSLLSIVDV